MTTIFIDTSKRVIVADTRMTMYKGNKRSYSTLNKVFKSKCGKFHVTGSGCVLLIHNYMRNILNVEVGVNVTEGCSSSKGDKGTILITNKYNKQVKCIELTRGVHNVKCKISYITNDFITSGSGSSIVSSLWYKVDDPLRIVHYASMKDRCTNDRISVDFY